MKTSKSTRPDPTPENAYRDHYPVIAPLIMGSGVGDGKTTSCVMAQAATIDALRKGLTLEKPTDEMECACPVLRRLAIRLNDIDWWASDAERTQFLRPLIPLLLDSRGDKKTTDSRVFFCVDQTVRLLTPIRLDWILENCKNNKVNEAIRYGIAEIKALAPITDNATAEAARAVCEKLKRNAYAYAYASASASAYAYASASAYADASAYASAYAYASASAYAYAYASASAYAYADADAIKAQKLKYRAALLVLFTDAAAIK